MFPSYVRICNRLYIYFMHICNAQSSCTVIPFVVHETCADPCHNTTFGDEDKTFRGLWQCTKQCLSSSLEAKLEHSHWEAQSLLRCEQSHGSWTETCNTTCRLWTYDIQADQELGSQYSSCCKPETRVAAMHWCMCMLSSSLITY